MPKYIPNICNISGCEEPEYKHHLCKRHYEFYSANPTTLRFMAEREALDNRRAEWKLKLKRIMQYIIHYVLNFPMPLVEHFPLEHIFLGELYSLEREDSVDSVRVEQVIEDFNIPENVYPYSVIVLGYPTEDYTGTDRFDKDRIHYETY